MTGDTNDPRLGGWAISQEVVNVISNLIRPGSIILELGSGTGTGLLSENYQMISIENNPEFLDLEDTRYIHAPIVDYDKSPFAGETGWYDTNIIRKEIPSEYDLLLIDGPPGRIGRSGILLHLDLFRSDRPIIVDDSHRSTEENIANEISNIWDMEIEISECAEKSNDGTIRTFHTLSPKI
jgi:hypothetical protein